MKEMFVDINWRYNRILHTSIMCLLLILLQDCNNRDSVQKEVDSDGIAVNADTLTHVTDKDSLNSVSVSIENIDSAEYHSTLNAVKRVDHEMLKITDFEIARTMLEGIVDFSSGNEGCVSEIHFRNGKNYSADDDCEIFFVAYFPEDDVLLCEGGHTSDVSFNLKNGKETEETGNPDLYIYSPNNMFRINGAYGGQECNGYFIQKKINGEYERYIDMETEFRKISSYYLCVIRYGFWSDEQTFYLEKFDYADENKKFKFFKIKINEQ